MARQNLIPLFTPVIQAIKSLGGSGRPSEVAGVVARNLNISEQERAETLKNGRSRFDNDIAWVRYFLARADILDSSRRGVWSLSDRGRAIDSLSDDEVLAIIQKVESENRDNRNRSRVLAELDEQSEEVIAPDENSESNDSSYRERLHEILLSLPPAGFERLCQRLLRETGFEQVEVTGRSGDGGIDGHGIVMVNAFVSFKVLFQCKRYEGGVSPSEVRDFRGAMSGRADKGIIITTGTFTAGAKSEAVRDGVPPIELVNGEKLLDLFEQYEVGLNPRKTFDVDIHFFQEFQS